MGEGRKLEACFEESKNNLSKLMRTEKEETRSYSSHWEGCLRGSTMQDCLADVTAGPWLLRKSIKEMCLVHGT